MKTVDLFHWQMEWLWMIEARAESLFFHVFSEWYPLAEPLVVVQALIVHRLRKTATMSNCQEKGGRQKERLGENDVLTL